jgi:hypothetical protein
MTLIINYIQHTHNMVFCFGARIIAANAAERDERRQRIEKFLKDIREVKQSGGNIREFVDNFMDKKHK